jgi:C-terminal processing protease CtpA/Prc
MRELVILLFSLFISAPPAQARGFKKSVAQKTRIRKPAYHVTPAESKYMQSLLRRCDDGNGQACNAYGHMLVQLDRPGDRRLAIRYIRRACVLAYTPACNRQSPREKAKFAGQHCGPETGKMLTLVSVRAASGSRAVQKVTRVSKGSVLDKAGLRPGDVIMKVNGSHASSANEVGDALENGKALLEISRAGAVVPMAIYCP